MGLIAISGKIGSGKDLIGKIIQYLIVKKRFTDLKFGVDNFYYAGFTGDIDTSVSCESGYEIVRFADKLKDIVCLLIGCTRKQLEDRDFKEEELSQEWWRYEVSYDDYDYKGEFITSTLEEAENEIRKLNCTKDWVDIDLVKLTPRLLLQEIGTNLLRNQLHPNIWVNATFANYKPHKLSEYNPSNWIITDCRFPNELQAVKDRGGVSIRVNRPCSTCTKYENKFCSNPYHVNNHESETALDNAEFDYAIENSGTIEDLIQKVKEVLIKEKIIND